VNSCHPNRKLKNLVKQCFTTKCSNSSVALFTQSKKQFALEKGFAARLGIFDSFSAHSQDPSSVANVGLHFPHLVFEDELEASFFQSFFCHRLKFFLNVRKYQLGLVSAVAENFTTNMRQITKISQQRNQAGGCINRQ